MKRILVVFAVITAFGLSSFNVGTLPYGNPVPLPISQPSHWYVQETGSCPYGYQCYYNIWTPSITINYPVWVFGITNNAGKGGFLHFREYPAKDCFQHCTVKISLLYKAEVVFVPSSGGNYLPENVPLTFVLPGRYVVTSPSFVMHPNMKVWFFSDRGGPRTMSVSVQTDKKEYGREDSSVTFMLQVTDDATQELIQVDTIYGTIMLPDNTQKTVDPEEWVWDDDKKWYTYSWDFANDKGVCADPKEGFYQAEFFVKKKYYADVKACTDFGVCYYIGIDLAFDKDPPEYQPGESVAMTVHVTDENGAPLSTGVKSVLTLPDGNTVTDLVWTPTDPGTYTASYMPERGGEYSITVWASEDVVCYLEETSGAFFVKCEEAHIRFSAYNTVIDEPVEFTLVVADGHGNTLPGAKIELDIYYQDEYVTTLSWTDEDGDGVYLGEYTPSELGSHHVRGTVTVLTEHKCFKSTIDEYFTVTKKDLPDLLIRNEDITIIPEEPVLGATVLISVTVWNVGKGDAEFFWVIILIEDEIVHREAVGKLAPGESITITHEWTVLYSGGFVIQAIVDPPVGLI